MKHLTGLFLGAGASYEAGMPLASDLTRQMKNLLNASKLRQLNAKWRLEGGGYPDEVWISSQCWIARLSTTKQPWVSWKSSSGASTA
jgi:hypothetical protein